MQRKRRVKGGDSEPVELTTKFIFKTARKLVEGLTNYALTHRCNLDDVSMARLSETHVNELQSKGCDLYEEVEFKKREWGLRKHVIVPREDCRMTFEDLSKFDNIHFRVYLQDNVYAFYVNTPSLERIIISQEYWITRVKDTNQYKIDGSLKEGLLLLNRYDRAFVDFLSKKKPEPERWWKLYKEYSEYMGMPDIQALKLKELYGNDPEKMPGGSKPKRTVAKPPVRKTTVAKK